MHCERQPNKKPQLLWFRRSSHWGIGNIGERGCVKPYSPVHYRALCRFCKRRHVNITTATSILYGWSMKAKWNADWSTETPRSLNNMWNSTDWIKSQQCVSCTVNEHCKEKKEKSVIQSLWRDDQHLLQLLATDLWIHDIHHHNHR